VNILDHAKFLDKQADLRRGYGEQASIVLAAALLKQLNCVSVDNYFELYEKKMKMLHMDGNYEHFRLGDPCRYLARPLGQEDVFDKRTAHACFKE
tara:strand:- start:261 stop:545 length:285 start_codon:yes stop_codon:yes gene_type:complete